MKKNKDLFLDIMLNDRFVCTLKYMYCPLFVIEYEALIKFVLDKRPSLKGKPFRIMFWNNKRNKTMKKNENDNLVAHFHSLCEEKKLKDEITKQQKRLWLRTKIHEIIGIPGKSTFEEIFNWIYQASIYEWEGMLYCFKYAKSQNHWREYYEVLEDAKELYSVLK